MKIPISKLARVWDEIKSLSRDDDLDAGDLCWCDFLFVMATNFEIQKDTDVNCADDCPKFDTDNCFLS